MIEVQGQNGIQNTIKLVLLNSYNMGTELKLDPNDVKRYKLPFQLYVHHPINPPRYKGYIYLYHSHDQEPYDVWASFLDSDMQLPTRDCCAEQADIHDFLIELNIYLTKLFRRAKDKFIFPIELMQYTGIEVLMSPTYYGSNFSIENCLGDD